MSNYSLLSLSMIAVISVASTQSNAQTGSGFRIETDVLTEGVAEPIQQSLTLFIDGIAYDISHDSGDITVVDPANDRIVQLNQQQQIQTTLSISTFKNLLKAAKSQATSSRLALLLLGAQKVVSQDGKIVVGDETLQYEATLQVPKETPQAVAEAYRDFADAAKLLSSFSLAGGTPPFARLALNEAIAKESAIPAEITVRAKTDDGQIVLKSRVHATWLLSKSDRLRIDDIGEMLANFEALDPAEFQHRRQTATRVAAAGGSGSK